MSRSITIAAASLNQTPLDWERNCANILAAISMAKSAGVDILCLPELCITGYGCEDMFFAPHLRETAWRYLRTIAAECHGITAIVGLPVEHNSLLYNCAAVLSGGSVKGVTAKKHLAGDGVHYEPRWFSPWPVGVQERIEREAESLPFGDVWYELDNVHFGIEICHDAWVPRRHGIDLAERGIDILFNPSASHFALGKRALVEELCVGGSLKYAPIYCFANLLGCEAGRTIYGGDRIIAYRGAIIANGDRFSLRDVEMTAATVPLIERKAPANETAAPTALPGTLRSTTRAPSLCAAPRASWEGDAVVMLRDQEISLQKLEEFTRTLTLGLFDYMRKCHARGFVISLSGGADSGAAATLVAVMVHRLMTELTPEQRQSKLPALPSLPEDERSLVKTLLTCIYQRSEQSSNVTAEAARGLAEAIGATFIHLDIAPMVTQYQSCVEAALQRRFSWESDDLTLQNIQARTRSPSAWMVANAKQALLLATGNRSEAAVGYATMDGDTSGGLSPLGGIDKAFIRRWLLWMEQGGCSITGSLPALAAINHQQPTAELRPPQMDQRDEKDLMPYDVLDRIERYAFVHHLSPVECYQKLLTDFDGSYPRRELGLWTERFFVLWSVNQWKRERYAPSFHLDEESLDPKSWLRFPILSGGFAVELSELRAAIAR